MSYSADLIALGVGYLVFLKASKEKDSLRQVGRIIGAVIIGLSILMGVCALKCRSGSGGLFSGKAPMCHFEKKV